MISSEDIHKLSDNQLIELQEIIVMEAEGRYRQRHKKALAAFEVGDNVSFEDHEGHRQDGTVLRVNQKSLTIKTERTGKWRVAPMFVKKSKQPREMGGRLFSLRPLREQ